MTNPHGDWYRLFEEIGIGQWCRFATGIMQVVGGALMLSGRSLVVGAAMVVTTMVGAACVDLFLFGSLMVVAL
jgi:hypothetical protein